MSQSVIAPSRIGPYLLKGTVGEGAFSIVKLAYHETLGQYFACKIVPKSRIVNGNLGARFEQEIRINQQMHHPGVVSLMDILKDEFNFYILMEFCPNGDLFQFIVDRNHLSEAESKPMIYQMLETLQYVHKMGVCHRDLKPENILISQSGQLKISDFGLSRFLLMDNLASTPCGSPCYASPECISGNPYDGKKSDIWSVGVIVYAMLTGQLPWTKRNQTQLFEQIRRGGYKIPAFLSENARSFVSGLMTVDVEQRLTIEQALRHPFLCDTPRQIYGDSPVVEYISLKRVDDFFDKDCKDNDVHIPIEKNTTKIDLTYGKVLRAIVEKLPQLVIRKNRITAPLSSRATTTKAMHPAGFESIANTRKIIMRSVTARGAPGVVIKPAVKANDLVQKPASKLARPQPVRKHPGASRL